MLRDRCLSNKLANHPGCGFALRRWMSEVIDHEPLFAATFGRRPAGVTEPIDTRTRIPSSLTEGHGCARLHVRDILGQELWLRHVGDVDGV